MIHFKEHLFRQNTKCKTVFVNIAIYVLLWQELRIKAGLALSYLEGLTTLGKVFNLYAIWRHGLSTYVAEPVSNWCRFCVNMFMQSSVNIGWWTFTLVTFLSVPWDGASFVTRSWCCPTNCLLYLMILCIDADMIQIFKQAGDANSSYALGLTAGIYGCMNVHRSYIVLCAMRRCIGSFVFIQFQLRLHGYICIVDIPLGDN